MTKAARFAVQVVLQVVTLSLFWIACVATFHTHEMFVGLAAVTLSVAFCVYVIHTLPLEFQPRLRDLIQVWRLPWYVVTDVARVTWILFRDLAGHPAGSHFVAAPWGPVENNGRDTARRALAVAYTTVSPNCVVVGVDCGRGQILLHELEPTSLSRMTRNLGAEDAA
jgi:hypothetical protein